MRYKTNRRGIFGNRLGGGVAYIYELEAMLGQRSGTMKQKIKR